MNKAVSLLCLLLLGCSISDRNGLQFSEKGRQVPAFDSDSAYKFIQRQVEFGPRVPNTYGHVKTREYLENKLKQYAGSTSVYSQEFTSIGYNNDTLQWANIIAAFNLSATDRIVIAAHWDTRPRADMDDERTAEFIPGADDGGSGVGVILELARVFSKNPPPVGVDLILFDGEDYGTSDDLANYFLGSRYWSEYPPVPGYRPRFGILLDMVGAENATFPKEQYSLAYAPNLVEEVWSIALDKGYEELFLDQEGAGVLDDHYIINEQTDIPMINIINHSVGPDGNVIFAPHWHTHDDNLEIIDKETLQAVGEVLLELIYNRI